MTERILFWEYYASGRDGIFAKSSQCMWHSAPNCGTVKFAKPWMSSHFFPESRYASYVGSAMRPECPVKDWRLASKILLGCTHGYAAQGSSKDQVEWLQLRPSLFSSWCGISRTTWDCCWPRGISSRPGTAAPATFSVGKTGTKMNVHSNCFEASVL